MTSEGVAKEVFAFTVAAEDLGYRRFLKLCSFDEFGDSERPGALPHGLFRILVRTCAWLVSWFTQTWNWPDLRRGNGMTQVRPVRWILETFASHKTVVEFAERIGIKPMQLVLAWLPWWIKDDYESAGQVVRHTMEEPFKNREDALQHFKEFVREFVIR